jgi:hypothetical protein
VLQRLVQEICRGWLADRAAGIRPGTNIATARDATGLIRFASWTYL